MGGTQHGVMYEGVKAGTHLHECLVADVDCERAWHDLPGGIEGESGRAERMGVLRESREHE